MPISNGKNKVCICKGGYQTAMQMNQDTEKSPQSNARYVKAAAEECPG